MSAFRQSVGAIRWVGDRGVELVHKTGTGEGIEHGVFNERADLALTTVEGVAIASTDSAR